MAMKSSRCARSAGATFSIERATRSLVGGAFLFGASLSFALGIQACSDESDDTGGKRVVLHTRVTVDPEAMNGFDSGLGWHVTIDELIITVGPIHYFDGAPPLVVNERETPSRWASRWLGLGTAFAHPGHYQAGNALGEMLETTSVDLLAGPFELPDGEGVTGTFRSARFTFPVAPSGPFAGELGTHVALVEGTATKSGEETRVFRAVGDFSEIAKSESNAEISGCQFVETKVEGDGTVTLTVIPRVWFNIVDFAQSEPGAVGAPVEFPVGSQPRIAFTQGLAQLSAYRFEYSN
jgi:hypothetical protein